MRVSSTEKPMPSSEEMISAITLLRSLTVWPSFVESSTGQTEEHAEGFQRHADIDVVPVYPSQHAERDVVRGCYEHHGSHGTLELAPAAVVEQPFEQRYHLAKGHYGMWHPLRISQQAVGNPTYE